METTKLKWCSLLHLTELDFIPEAPKVLEVSDELLQTISWLTGATGHDRRLLRCTENGALLVADAWSLFGEVVTDELHPAPSVSDTFSTLIENKGVLIATSTEIIKVEIRRVAGGNIETIYIPPVWMYWYPYRVYSVKASTVPADTGTASYVGITAFN